MRNASSAAMIRPVSIRRSAWPGPTNRGSDCVPVAPAIAPSFTSGKPKVALAAATRTSQASAITAPPPSVTPLQAAITGTGLFGDGLVQRNLHEARPLDPLGCDLELADVRSGRERPSIAREHHTPDRAVRGKRVECRPQLPTSRDRQHAVRPRHDSDEGDPVRGRRDLERIAAVVDIGGGHGLLQQAEAVYTALKGCATRSGCHVAARETLTPRGTALQGRRAGADRLRPSGFVESAVASAKAEAPASECSTKVRPGVEPRTGPDQPVWAVSATRICHARSRVSAATRAATP